MYRLMIIVLHLHA